jgi:hypothetical protein
MPGSAPEKDWGEVVARPGGRSNDKLRSIGVSYSF